MNPSWLASHRDAGALLLYATASAFLLFPGSASGEDPSQPPRSVAIATDFLPEDVAPPVVPNPLSRRNELKAEALAAYVEGFLAETGADIDRELTHYRRVLTIDPGATIRTPDGDELLLSVKVAYELARRGDISEGIGILKDSIKAVPDDPVAYLYLAQLYSRFLHKPDLALNYAMKALALAPEELDTYSTIYEILVASDQPKKAEEALDRAAKVQTDDPAFWSQLSDLYLRLLIHEDGATPPEAIAKMDRVVEKALRLGGDDSDIVAKAADYYVLSSQVGKAVPLYEKVVAQHATSTEPAALDIRDKLARSYLASGQRDRAIEELHRITKLNPLRYESYELLGELYQQQQDYDRALDAYQQGLLLAPNQPLNYLRIAAMQQETKRFDKAVQTLTEARKRFPDYPRITYTLAFALSQAERHQEAVTAFEEALREAEVLQDDMLTAEFYFNYGAAAEMAGFPEKAVELMKKSIELDPAQAARAYNYIGYLWVDRDQNLEEAGRLIRKALEMDPDNAAFLDSLGWYYYKTGKFEKALAELLRSAQLIEIEDPVVYDHIGDAYAKLNNVAQALIYWQKAAALDATDTKIGEKIEQAKRKLTSLPAPLPASPESPKPTARATP